MLVSEGVRAWLASRADGQVEWRLLAANGRVLALSADGFDDDAQARNALADVVARSGRLMPQIVHPGSSVSWCWSALTDEGRAVAVGERPYARYGTCVTSFERFRVTSAALRTRSLTDLFSGRRS